MLVKGECAGELIRIRRWYPRLQVDEGAGFGLTEYGCFCREYVEKLRNVFYITH